MTHQYVLNEVKDFMKISYETQIEEFNTQNECLYGEVFINDAKYSYRKKIFDCITHTIVNLSIKDNFLIADIIYQGTIEGKKAQSLIESADYKFRCGLRLDPGCGYSKDLPKPTFHITRIDIVPNNT